MWRAAALVASLVIAACTAGSGSGLLPPPSDGLHATGNETLVISIRPPGTCFVNGTFFKYVSTTQVLPVALSFGVSAFSGTGTYQLQSPKVGSVTSSMQFEGQAGPYVSESGSVSVSQFNSGLSTGTVRAVLVKVGQNSVIENVTGPFNCTRPQGIVGN